MCLYLCGNPAENVEAASFLWIKKHIGVHWQVANDSELFNIKV